MTDKKPAPIKCNECRFNYLDHLRACPSCGAPKPEERPLLAKWDQRFLELAQVVSSWCKGPSMPVGAVLVDQKRRVIGTGYNGFARGVEETDHRLKDDEFRRAATVHAEHNAVSYATGKVEGSTLYLYGLPPCPSCTAAVILQNGIRRVVTAVHPSNLGRVDHWMAQFERLSVPMLKDAGVAFEVYQLNE